MARLVVLVGLLALQLGEGTIYNYNKIPLAPSSVLVSTHGIFGAANGAGAFVHVHLKFSPGYNAEGVSDSSKEIIQIVFLKIPDLEQEVFYGPSRMSCSKEGPNGGLLDAEQMGNVDGVVNVTINGDGTGSVDTKFPALSDGKYALVYARCHPSNVLVHMDGHVEWMSEFGLLAGEYWNLVPFYALLTTVYGIIIITWIVHMHKYANDLISLQYYMFLVLVFNFVETSLCLANLYTANASGRPLSSGGWWLVSETARVIADTMCRTFLLLLCLGLGIITSKLSMSTWSGVNAFSAVYFTLKLLDHLRFFVQTWYSFALFAMDVCLLMWLFIALMEAEKKLDEQEFETGDAGLKKELYQGIRFLLIMFLFVTCICFSSLYSMATILPWTLTWIQHCFEDCVVFLIIFYLAVAWLPSPTTHLYAPVELEMNVRKSAPPAASDDGPSYITSSATMHVDPAPADEVV